jgi:hypothetical protein
LLLYAFLKKSVKQDLEKPLESNHIAQDASASNNFSSPASNFDGIKKMLKN